MAMKPAKVGKKTSKNVKKRNLNKTRRAVEMLDASAINLQDLMQDHQPQSAKSVLDSKQMKQALRDDEVEKVQKQKAEQELASQMELITGIAIGESKSDKRKDKKK